MTSETSTTSFRETDTSQLSASKASGALAVSLGIVFSEGALYFGATWYALSGHLVTLIGAGMLGAVFEDESDVFVALGFLPVFRLVNLGMPMFFEQTLFWVILTYGSLLPSFFFIRRAFRLKRQASGGDTSSQNSPSNGSGTRLNRQGSREILSYFTPQLQSTLPFRVGWVEALTWGGPGIVIGILIGELEYRLITPAGFVSEWTLASVIPVTIVMVAVLAFVEEFLFRGMLQSTLARRLGRWPGLVLASGMFGIMHSGHGLPEGLVFATGVGLVFGWVYDRTESLALVTLMHGAVNTALFVVIPLHGSLFELSEAMLL